MRARLPLLFFLSFLLGCQKEQEAPAEVEEAERVALEEISPDEELPTLEKDRMTYDKAKRALEEDPE